MINRAFSIEIDVGSLARFEGRLGQLAEAGFGEAAVRVVNRTVDAAYDLAVPRMTERINLDPSYVRERMGVEYAKNPDDVRARVVAFGSKAHVTTLSRYGARQLMQPVKNPAGRKGDSLRGIPAGQKAAGVSVEVTRGARQALEVSGKPVNVFLMPLRNGNGMGVFARTGEGRKNYKHLYGPSVYQLFRYTINAGLGDEVATDFEQQLGDEAERLLQKALT